MLAALFHLMKLKKCIYNVSGTCWPIGAISDVKGLQSYCLPKEGTIINRILTSLSLTIACGNQSRCSKFEYCRNMNYESWQTGRLKHSAQYSAQIIWPWLLSFCCSTNETHIRFHEMNIVQAVLSFSFHLLVHLGSHRGLRGSWQKIFCRPWLLAIRETILSLSNSHTMPSSDRTLSFSKHTNFSVLLGFLLFCFFDLIGWVVF